MLVKRDTGKPLGDEASWHPVTGDPVNGYVVSSETGKKAALDSLKAEPHIFQRGQNGLYTIVGTELPGDVLKYYWTLQQRGEDVNESEYAMSIYFTTGSAEDATDDNTRLVETDNFSAQFSARIYVANIQNKFFVQKVDDAESPLAGAEFSLYKADQTEKDASGNRVLKSGAKVYDVATTVAQMDSPAIQGGAQFPTRASRPLVEGQTYYLKETAAPDGYELNETLIPVVVDKAGVHVYAGEDGVDDGVSVHIGVGRLVKTLAQYGSVGGTDVTLHNVMAALVTSGQSGELGAAELKWSNPDFDTTGASRADLLRLAYGNAAPGQPLYEYGPSSQIPAGGNTSVTASFESGWGMMSVRQDSEYGKIVAARENANYTNLGSQDLTPLFSGASRVVVRDRPLARLEVKKVVKADSLAGAAANDEFTFNVRIVAASGSVPAGGYAYRVLDAEGNELSSNRAGAGSGNGSADFKVTLEDGQSLRVYGLATGDGYTVSEPGTGMPAGYVLAGVNDGDGSVVDYVAAEGDPAAVVNKVAGDVKALGSGNAVPAANRLTYTNTIAGLRVLKLNAEGEKDSSGSYPALAGAEFSIRADASGADGVPEPGEKVSVAGFATSGTTDHDGYLALHGLPAGTYWLVEDRAPGGFAVMQPLRFKVETVARAEADGGPYVRLSRVNADGSDGAEIPQKPVVAGGGASDTIATITIENRAMTELPQTGSSARPLLFIAAFFVLGAAGFVLARAWEGGRR